METFDLDKPCIFGVAVKAALVRERRLLIVQRSDSDTSAPGMWEFCGGRVEFGEHPMDALVREVQEEAGLGCTLVRPLYVGSFIKSPSRQVVIVTFLAAAGPGKVALSFEHKDYLWATRSQARQLLIPEIVHSMQRHGVFPQLEIDD